MIDINKVCEINFNESSIQKLSLPRLKNIKKAIYTRFANYFVIECDCPYKCYTYTPKTHPELFNLKEYNLYRANLSLVFNQIQKLENK